MYQRTVSPASKVGLLSCTITRLAMLTAIGDRPFSFVVGAQQYTMLWIQNGSGRFTIDGSRRVIYPQYIYCLLPGQRVQLIAGAVNGWQLTFHKEFPDVFEKAAACLIHGTLLNYFSERPVIPISPVLESSLDTMISLIQQQELGEAPLHLEVVRNLLRIFIIYLCTHSKSRLPGNSRRAGAASSF